MDLLALVLLAVCCLVGLILVPLGLPGLWVMVAGILGYGWLTGFGTVGVGTIALVLGLAMTGEVLEAWVGFRTTRRYGGSRRAGWGALLGGLIGAVVGVPVPIVGSVIGAFVGSFAGAVLFELSATRRMDSAVSAGWGAVIGRALAAAFKIALGLVMCVVAAFAALRG
ncbi:MAG TPA: DUF456 domain-containing protein [Gemmatimonadales bacterium]|nr:DUF456 domain-containing protein [Gemmatimonadales bacterium]